MKKLVYGRKLKRDKNERKALFKGLMSALVLKESIKTTEQKAKSIKGQVEKLVTKAKKNGVSAKRFLNEYLTSPAMEKLITDVAPRFSKRSGGYTRIARLGRRFNDDAKMVLLEWVEKSGNQKSEVREQKIEDKGLKTETKKTQLASKTKELEKPKRVRKTAKK